MSESITPELTLLDGRFQLETLLGRGGMADVYRATDLHHGRPVAVKILRGDAVGVIGIERFRREIAVTAAFTHPHILGLIESGETETQTGARMLYYVMPLIDGESLRHRLAREDHLPVRDGVRITREVLDALQYAHEHGVIHRDIKPANILLSGGHAVVADFGIARPVARHAAATGDESTLTVSGVSIGTPAYMSPEQALAGSTVDARSDLYATGCVLYETLTGRAPFDASTAQAVIARKASGVFVPPSIMRPGLPKALDDIVSRALHPDPADRYLSAAAFLAALEAIGETGVSTSATIHDRVGERVDWRSRRRGMIPLLIGVCVIVAGAWAWARTKGGPSANATTSSTADAARVAVLPFENLSSDSSLAYVANGITTDLTDELAQVHALTVVSKNGVIPLVRKSIGIDSLARVLRVGSVITGDVRRSGQGVIVSVRLVDGRTGQQLASHDTSGAMDDLLQVRSTVVDDVARFLRQRLGEQIRVSSSQRRASNPEAWELVERVRDLQNGELRNAWQLAPEERTARFRHADSLAIAASRLDARWADPLVERALLSARQALTEETTARMGRAGSESGRETARTLYRDDVHWCDEALKRDPADASALHARGAARMELWRLSPDAMDDSLRVEAEADLRAALDRRPDLAVAWTDLSRLLTASGKFAQAEQAAVEALHADEYLLKAEDVLAGLHFAALAAGHTDHAIKWCAEGRKRFPDDQRFFACELITIGWTGDKPSDVARAWRVLDDAEKRYTADALQSGWATRRFLVAATAARAGLRDSALAIIAHTRAELPSQGSAVTADYGEAQVRALLGQYDEALQLLDRYLRAFPMQRLQVAHIPLFRALWHDPRFAQMTSVH